MLSKIMRVAFFRSFSTNNTALSKPQPNILSQRNSTSQTTTFTDSQIESIKSQAQTEKKHFQFYLSEIKQELGKSSQINFQLQKNSKRLVLETMSADGSNNWRFAQIITGASAYHLLTLLAGYPSYVSLAATFTFAAIGASLSYSNYLRRTSPQITQVFQGQAGKLHIHFLKSSPFTRFLSSQHEIVVEDKSWREISFGSAWLNFLRKGNNTRWVKIDGQVYWFNGNLSELRVNNFWKA